MALQVHLVRGTRNRNNEMGPSNAELGTWHTKCFDDRAYRAATRVGTTAARTLVSRNGHHGKW